MSTVRALLLLLSTVVALSLVGCDQNTGTSANGQSEARRAAANLEATVATGWAGDGTTSDEWVAQKPAAATETSGENGANPTITWTFKDGSSIYAEFSIESYDDNGDNVDDRKAVVLRKFLIQDEQ